MSQAVVTLRDMGLEDVGQVSAIEAACFASPWSPSFFRYELESADAWARVAVDGSGQVLGYLLARLFVDAWHLMDVAVAAQWRLQGIAGHLLTEFLDRTAPLGIECTLEVRTGNVAAIAMYEGFGFQVVGKRRGYYADTGEDALLMTLQADAWMGRGGSVEPAGEDE